MYFHEDIVALNDDEITFVSNFYCIQTYSKRQEVNLSNDVINDIVFYLFVLLLLGQSTIIELD